MVLKVFWGWLSSNAHSTYVSTAVVTLQIHYYAHFHTDYGEIGYVVTIKQYSLGDGEKRSNQAAVEDKVFYFNW